MEDTLPIKIENQETISQLFRCRSEYSGKKTALKEKDLGIWKEITWAQYYQFAQSVGSHLLHLGCHQGSVVSILSENNKEWLFCDMGIVGMGGITNGIYPTDAPEQVRYLLLDSSSELIFVENEEQLDKVLEIRDDIPNLKKIVVFDWKGLRTFHDPQVESFQDFLEQGKKLASSYQKQWDEAINTSKSEDINCLHMQDTA